MLSFGTIILTVSKEMAAGGYNETMKKVNELINNLNVNIDTITVTTIDGTVHNLAVHDFQIEWEDVLE